MSVDDAEAEIEDEEADSDCKDADVVDEESDGGENVPVPIIPAQGDNLFYSSGMGIS